MRWIAGRWIWILVLIGVGGATGCQTVSITRVGRGSTAAFGPPMSPAAGWPATESVELSDGTRATTGILSPLPEPVAGDPVLLLTQAETNRRAGVRAASTSRHVASRYELTAVAEAIEAMQTVRTERLAGVDDGDAQAARAVYSASLRDFLRDSSGRRVQLDRKWEQKLAAQNIRIQFDPEASTFRPDQFDEFLFSSDYEIKGIEHQYKYEGLGVPLTGVRLYRVGNLTQREGEAKFLMPTEVYPVTAILKPRSSKQTGTGDGIELTAFRPEPASVGGHVPLPPHVEYTLELHDPIIERKVEFAGRSEPLATDLTTSLTYHFVHSPLPILQEIGLLDPQWLESLAGLYMLHPYIPGKIPIIFVHGLRSSPAAWLKVMNEIRGDPDLRDRYQIWLFMYPTGTPFPYSAAKLRSQMNELRAVVDPEHADAALDRSVLIGHSMGGLITRLMISASGDALWNLVGRRPFEELKANDERKEMLRNVFFFEPHPMVTRAVFIATPHRGSELGDEFIGRLADRLIRIPGSLRSTYRALLFENGRDFFTPEVRSGMPSSIDELRRDNRLLMAMSRLPRRPGLEAHSVIGRKDPAQPIEDSTDGVVPYASSHIDWAVSEKVVTGDHGCQDTGETIEELRRILKEHLRAAAGNLNDPEVKQTGGESPSQKNEATPRPRPRARRISPVDPKISVPAKSTAVSRSSWQPIQP